MLKSLTTTLVLLGHSLAVSAKPNAGGLQVYPGTGDLAKFPVITWRFNGGMQQWGSHPELNFVPMIKDEATVNDLPGALVTWLASPEISHVFSFDAPHLIADGGMSAAKAAEIQKQITSDIRGAGLGKFQLGTPSIRVRYGMAEQSGDVWLEDMMAACNGECQNDFIVIDYEGTDPEAMSMFIDSLHRKHQLPIWIKSIKCLTNFGGYCFPETALTFMTRSIEWFSSTDYVERWAWDGADPTSASRGDSSGLLNEDGSLNAQGKAFNEVELAWLGPAE